MVATLPRWRRKDFYSQYWKMLSKELLLLGTIRRELFLQRDAESFRNNDKNPSSSVVEGRTWGDAMCCLQLFFKHQRTKGGSHTLWYISRCHVVFLTSWEITQFALMHPLKSVTTNKTCRVIWFCGSFQEGWLMICAGSLMREEIGATNACKVLFTYQLLSRQLNTNIRILASSFYWFRIVVLIKWSIPEEHLRVTPPGQMTAGSCAVMCNSC